jgi:uncharacterized protein (TIGR02594 family)
MADTAPPWLVRAASYLGFHEIGDNQGIGHFIDDAHVGQEGDPWCAIFANACLEEAGVPGTRSAMARSFEHNANFVELDQPALGCIITRWRQSKASGLGHVFFYCGENENGIVAIAGNENDAVRRYYESKSTVVGYFWPKSVSLPTSGPLRLPVANALRPASWEGIQTVPAPAGPPPPKPTRVGRSFHAQGTCGTFGGPNDTGMEADEGLALFPSAKQMRDAGIGDYVLADSGYPGLGRSLDPSKNYLACRWDYAETPVSTLRDASALVSANGKTALARPVDWGPNVRTGRVVDLSPGLAKFLGVQTDEQEVTVIFPAPTPAPIEPEPTMPTQPPLLPGPTPMEPQIVLTPEQFAALKKAADPMWAALGAKLISLVFSAAGASQLGIWGTVGLQALSWLGHATPLLGTPAPPSNTAMAVTTLGGLVASAFTQMFNRITQPTPSKDT